MEFDTLEDRIRQFFQSGHRDLVVVYLFGSRARETQKVQSDVDVAVLFKSQPPKTFEGLHLRMEGDLERHLGIPVDLTVLNTAPVDLRKRVLRDGKILIEQDRSRRIQFEVKTRNEFFDLEPVLLQYRGIKRKKA